MDFLKKFVQRGLKRDKNNVKLAHRRVSEDKNSFEQMRERFSRRFVYRFFWGRGSLYKTSLHVLIGITSLLVLFTGVQSGFASDNSNTIFADNAITRGNTDILQQGSGVQALQTSSQIFNFQVTEYKVVDGDTLDSIAERFEVSKRSIIDSNRDKIDFYEENVTPGDTLLIPPLEGVLYKTSSDDTVDSLLEKFENANKFDIVELNNLKKPDFEVPDDEVIIVAGAQLPAPPAPVTVQTFNATYVPAPQIQINPDGSKPPFRGITFVNPLGACPGYGFSRGFTGWHNGVDLTRRGGCVISAAAGGVVTFAGWSATGEGFRVDVDHGSGIRSTYWHGSGEFYVSVGQAVSPGQALMYMGCTGYCTGTHLHLSVYVDGIFSDPYPFIPY